MPKIVKFISKQEIENKFFIEKKSVKDIVIELKCSKSYLYKLCKEYNINTKKVKPSKELLYNLYIIEDKNTIEIGKILQVGHSSIIYYLKYYNIPTKNKKIFPKKNESLLELYPDIAKEWSVNNKLSASDVKCFSNKIVEWQCNKCKNLWKAIISTRTKQGHGCPNCSCSKGEKEIINYLNRYNIKYTHQYRIKECRNKFPLPFDFAIFKEGQLVLLIEYNGKQHYKLCTGYFNDKNHFENIKIRDKIKLNYCKKHNIPLLIISYKQFNNINEILTQWIK